MANQGFQPNNRGPTNPLMFRGQTPNQPQYQAGQQPYFQGQAQAQQLPAGTQAQLMAQQQHQQQLQNLAQLEAIRRAQVQVQFNPAQQQGPNPVATLHQQAATMMQHPHAARAPHPQNTVTNHNLLAAVNQVNQAGHQAGQINAQQAQQTVQQQQLIQYILRLQQQQVHLQSQAQAQQAQTLLHAAGQQQAQQRHVNPAQVQAIAMTMAAHHAAGSSQPPSVNLQGGQIVNIEQRPQVVNQGPARPTSNGQPGSLAGSIPTSQAQIQTPQQQQLLQQIYAQQQAQQQQAQQQAQLQAQPPVQSQQQPAVSSAHQQLAAQQLAAQQRQMAEAQQVQSTQNQIAALQRMQQQQLQHQAQQQQQQVNQSTEQRTSVSSTTAPTPTQPTSDSNTNVFRNTRSPSVVSATVVTGALTDPTPTFRPQLSTQSSTTSKRGKNIIQIKGPDGSIRQPKPKFSTSSVSSVTAVETPKTPVEPRVKKPLTITRPDPDFKKSSENTTNDRRPSTPKTETLKTESKPTETESSKPETTTTTEVESTETPAKSVAEKPKSSSDEGVSAARGLASAMEKLSLDVAPDCGKAAEMKVSTPPPARTPDTPSSDKVVSSGKTSLLGDPDESKRIDNQGNLLAKSPEKPRDKKPLLSNGDAPDPVVAKPTKPEPKPTPKSITTNPLSINPPSTPESKDATAANTPSTQPSTPQLDVPKAVASASPEKPSTPVVAEPVVEEKRPETVKDEPKDVAQEETKSDAVEKLKEESAAESPATTRATSPQTAPVKDSPTEKAADKPTSAVSNKPQKAKKDFGFNPFKPKFAVPKKSSPKMKADTDSAGRASPVPAAPTNTTSTPAGSQPQSPKEPRDLGKPTFEPVAKKPVAEKPAAATTESLMPASRLTTPAPVVASGPSRSLDERRRSSVTQYGRDMLLNFQKLKPCMALPEGWDADRLKTIMFDAHNPEIKKVMDQLNSPSQNPVQLVDMQNISQKIMTRNRGQAGSASYDARRGGGNDRGGGGRNDRDRRGSAAPGGGDLRSNKKVISLPSKNQKLEGRENAFKFGLKGDKKETSVQQKVRSYLNKLCPENYDKLSQEIIALDMSSCLQEIVTVIFEKAIDETHFSAIYGDLCCDLTNHYKALIAGEKDDKKRQQLKETCDFRTELIKSVQQAFQRYDKAEGEKTDEDVMKRLCSVDERIVGFNKNKEEAREKYKDPKDKKKLDAELHNWKEEIEEREKKIMARRYGNVTFIGNLYQRDLLIDKVVHDYCIKTLLKTATDEAVESLFQLLVQCGDKIEKRAKAGNRKGANPKGGKNQGGSGSAMIDSYFKRMETLMTNKSNGLKQKSRFRLQDLLEMRAAGWEKRKNMAGVNGPKKIDDVHKQAAQKEKEEAEKVAQMSQGNYNNHGGYNRQDSRRDMHNNNRQPPRNTRMGRGSIDGRPRGNQTDADGWETQGTAPTIARRKDGFQASKLNSVLGKSGSTKRSLGGGGLKASKGGSIDKQRGDSGSRSGTPTLGTRSRFSMLEAEDTPQQSPMLNGNSRGFGGPPSRNNNSALRDIAGFLKKEPEQKEETVLKLAGSILEDILNAQVSQDEGAKQWYGKSVSHKDTNGKDVRYERISIKGLSVVIKDRLEDLVINRTQLEVSRFGVFMRYLISHYDKEKVHVEEQIFKGAAECIKNWIECESWCDCPKLWENTAEFFAPLFDRKEHCKDLPTFGAAEFNKICELCFLKDEEFGDMNYKSLMAVHLMRKLIGNGFLQNQWQCQKFWKDAKMSWVGGYDKMGQKDFIKAAQSCNLRHLSIFEEVESTALPFLQIVDKHGEKATDILDLTKKSFDPKTADRDTTCAVFQQISTHILAKFVRGDITPEQLEDTVGDCCATFMEAFEQHETLNTSLELELLYAAECTYCELRSINRPRDILMVMNRLWDSLAFSKDTILTLWNQPRTGGSTFRGGDEKTRGDMQVEVTNFIQMVNESEE